MVWRDRRDETHPLLGNEGILFATSVDNIMTLAECVHFTRIAMFM